LAFLAAAPAAAAAGRLPPAPPAPAAAAPPPAAPALAAAVSASGCASYVFQRPESMAARALRPSGVSDEASTTMYEAARPQATCGGKGGEAAAGGRGGSAALTSPRRAAVAPAVAPLPHARR
jgi:hypothetical protein